MTMVDARFFNYRRNPKSNAGLGCKWYRFCGLPAGPGRKKIEKIVTARSRRAKKGHFKEIHPAETMFKQGFEPFPPKMRSRA
jgi:hypothetical protein